MADWTPPEVEKSSESWKPKEVSEIPVPTPSVEFRQAVAEKDAGVTPVEVKKAEKVLALTK